MQYFGIALAPECTLTGFGHVPTKVFRGQLFDRIRVVGWSTNLQSSYGVTNDLRRALAEKTAELVTDSTV